MEDSTDDFEDRSDTIRNLSNLATTTYDAETFERQMAMFSDPNSLLTDPRRSAPKKRGICQVEFSKFDWYLEKNQDFNRL